MLQPFLTESNLYEQMPLFSEPGNFGAYILFFKKKISITAWKYVFLVEPWIQKSSVMVLLDQTHI